MPYLKDSRTTGGIFLLCVRLAPVVGIRENEGANREAPHVTDPQTAKTAATLEEAAAALQALTEADYARLSSFARTRILRIGRAADQRDHEDLLSEALGRTLDGRRSWYQPMSIVDHLFGAMRSVSSHWAETFATEQRTGRDQLLDTLDARTDLLHEKNEAPNPERAALASDQLRRVRHLFEDDPLADTIIDGWEDGLDGPTICEVAEVDARTFHSKVRAIRRRLIAEGHKASGQTKGDTRG